MRLLGVWLINAAALVALPWLLPGIRVEGFGTAMLAALVLGLINAILRPLLVLLTLPVTLLSLGLFILVINGAMFLLATKLLDGFAVDGLWAAILGSIVYSVVSWLLTRLLLVVPRS